MGLVRISTPQRKPYFPQFQEAFPDIWSVLQWPQVMFLRYSYYYEIIRNCFVRTKSSHYEQWLMEQKFLLSILKSEKYKIKEAPHPVFCEPSPQGHLPAYGRKGNSRFSERLPSQQCHRDKSSPWVVIEIRPVHVIPTSLCECDRDRSSQFATHGLLICVLLLYFNSL